MAGRQAWVRVVLLGVALGASPATAGAEVWRRPLWIEQGLPVVEVWIGRSGPYRFVVDTGAEGSTVSQELAARRELPVVAGALEQHTMAGPIRRAAVRVPGLRIGSFSPAVQAEGLLAAVSDLRAMRAVVPGVDGVLGADVLSGCDYLLDFQAGSLWLARDEQLSLRGGTVLPLQFDRHRPVVSWPRAGSTGPVPLALDTGADALVMDAAQAGSFPCRPRTRDHATLETHAGPRDVRTCELEPLQAGALEVHGLRMVEVAWPSTLERVDRGLLPAAAFGRVYVSSARGTLTVWPR